MKDEITFAPNSCLLKSGFKYYCEMTLRTSQPATTLSQHLPNLAFLFNRLPLSIISVQRFRRLPFSPVSYFHNPGVNLSSAIEKKSYQAQKCFRAAINRLDCSLQTD
jgi:hypothetical protein